MEACSLYELTGTAISSPQFGTDDVLIDEQDRDRVERAVLVLLDDAG
ncbi:hypothetical protein [Jiangella alkaliphila]|nr:hypothetical protein [Jiangella alkaliphila]